MNRRQFIKMVGISSGIIAAPGIVKAGVLMPVKKIITPPFAIEYHDFDASFFDDPIRIYVDSNAPGRNAENQIIRHDGRSWTTAYKTIDDAIGDNAIGSGIIKLSHNHRETGGKTKKWMTKNLVIGRLAIIRQ